LTTSARRRKGQNAEPGKKRVFHLFGRVWISARNPYSGCVQEQMMRATPLWRDPAASNGPGTKLIGVEAPG
jgi:hypothetical protein